MKYDVILTDVGRKKIEVIKLIRENTGMGLAEAQSMVEARPIMLLQDVTQSEAETAQTQLQMVGASVIIQEHSANVPVENNSNTSTVVLLDIGSKKINVTKIVREFTGLGLKAALDLVESTPAVLMQGIDPIIAEEARMKLTHAGATVQIKGASPSTMVESSASSANDLCEVVLLEVGRKKINVISTVREFTNLGLKDAKDLVESAPVVLIQSIDPIIAEEARMKLTRVGATVEVRC